jgi:CRISPR-associated protein Cas6/Cse3/CasE subtype I-E
MTLTIPRCEAEIDFLAAAALARHRNVAPSVINSDEGVIIGNAIAEAFNGHAALRPWVVINREGTHVIVRGNGSVAELRLALDLVKNRLAKEAIVDLREVGAIDINEGLRYRFSTRLCPLQNGRAGDGRSREIDVFLAEVEKQKKLASPERLRRDDVYLTWLGKKLQEAGASLRAATINGFSITAAGRSNTKREWVIRKYPDARFSGVLTVEDATKFSAAVKQGIGRQKVYGFGFLELEPIQ